MSTLQEIAEEALELMAEGGEKMDSTMWGYLTDPNHSRLTVLEPGERVIKVKDILFWGSWPIDGETIVLTEDDEIIDITEEALDGSRYAVKVGTSFKLTVEMVEEESAFEGIAPKSVAKVVKAERMV